MHRIFRGIALALRGNFLTRDLGSPIEERGILGCSIGWPTKVGSPRPFRNAGVDSAKNKSAGLDRGQTGAMWRTVIPVSCGQTR